MQGVSKACVSRYFNHGYVSEEKRKKIKEVVEQTGYVPNKKIQSVTQTKRPTVGVIIPKINSESISRMIAGISQVLNREGYRMLLADTENSVEKEIQYFIIRTLDIGADKQVDYFELGKEENPAMGYRAIRICLKQPEIFKNQLRALLRAAVYGNISVKYPMISICVLMKKFIQPLRLGILPKMVTEIFLFIAIPEQI